MQDLGWSRQIDTARRRLRALILDDAYPPGTRLTEPEIAEAPGIGRTRVREAMRARGVPADLAAPDALAAGRLQQAVEDNRRFHRGIAELAGNPIALSTLDRLWDQVRSRPCSFRPPRPDQRRSRPSTRSFRPRSPTVAPPMPAGSPAATPSTAAPAPIRKLTSMARLHTYDTVVAWTADPGTGDQRLPPLRSRPRGRRPGAAPIAGSLSLHLGADARVVATGYVDHAHGTMAEAGEGGCFTEVVLRPQVSVASPTMVEAAMALHGAAHRACCIASSVNFPVHHQPRMQAVAA